MRRLTPTIEPEAPATLALLRIMVAGIVATSPEVWSGMALEATNAALRTPPEGLAWFAAHVPITTPLLNVARAIVLLAAVSGVLGLYARASFGVLLAASAYLFGCSELVGAARHNMHLMWFTGLLAVSPCGAFWSMDAARGRAHDDARAATIAVWAARALLAAVYFFPGYWKLRESGWHWAFSDNLSHQMYWKWYQNAWMPALRIDRYPAVVRGGAALVLLLELSFPLLILGRRTRMLAAMGALAFHLFAGSFMLLGFSSLWLCYAPLLDMRRLLRWLYEADVVPPADDAARVGLFERRVLPITLVGALLVGANSVQGFRGAFQAWPFACYPTFQWEAGPTMPDLVVTARLPGEEWTLYAGTRGLAFRDPREWGTLFRLLGSYGEPVRPDGLRAFYERLCERRAAQRPPAGTDALVFYRAEFSVLPEDRGAPPVRRSVVAVTKLSVPGS